MAHGSHCRATDLVHNRAVRIRACPCGMISLHLGPFSLRISEAAFAGLAEAVAEAFARLQHTQRLQPARAADPFAEEFLAG